MSEWLKRNEGHIEAGNKAAHYGSPLADAVRVYEVDKTEKSRTWYEEQYGTVASFVFEKIGPHRGPLFLNVLYWHGAVRNFDHVYSVTNTWRGNFMSEWRDFKEALSKSGKQEDDDVATWITEYFKDNEDGKKSYARMKEEYETGYERNKERRKQMQR